ncbi:STAS domain-containing protein [Candidatus Margulisiibacteriota bacterium]
MEKLEINHQRGISILKIQGDIEGDDGSQLLEIVQGAEQGALPFWLLEIPDTNFMDSNVLESILQIALYLRERKGDLFIAAPTPGVREILMITKLDKKIKIFAAVENALENIYQTQPGR